MAFNVVRYRHAGRVGWGVVRAGTITPLADEFPTTGDLIRHVSTTAPSTMSSVSARDIAILSPITRNQQFVCLGANYRQHMIESGMDPDVKSFNMVFTKAPSCIVPADSDVVRPRGVRFLDYEIELGLVIRRDITASTVVTDADLHEFIAGAVIVNDYSARDVQIPQMQFYKGKSFRTFGPVGPYLCLLEAGDMAALKDLNLTLTVNGAVRQKDSTRNLVYGPAETLTELSGVHDLHPGDLLSTGTPAGCALSIPSPAMQRIAALLPERMRWEAFMRVQAKRSGYLNPGDVVEASIRSDDGAIDLGVQRNVVVEG
ncbi:MAG TPA: fumarylacetoacetate hydrolase family protein [Candidatus Binatia bacterium]|nr:fumarylacetoacetate hydrolase family protein [Candidatus Binatia bacterium]